MESQPVPRSGPRHPSDVSGVSGVSTVYVSFADYGLCNPEPRHSSGQPPAFSAQTPSWMPLFLAHWLAPRVPSEQQPLLDSPSTPFAPAQWFTPSLPSERQPLLGSGGALSTQEPRLALINQKIDDIRHFTKSFTADLRILFLLCSFASGAPFLLIAMDRDTPELDAGIRWTFAIAGTLITIPIWASAMGLLFAQIGIASLMLQGYAVLALLQHADAQQAQNSPV